MDLDNITDIEILRNELKKHMTQMKQDKYSNDGENYLFRKGFGYCFIQETFGVTIYSNDDMEHECFFDNEVVEKYLNVPDVF